MRRLSLLLVLFGISLPGWAQPTGVFYVGEANGNSFQARFEFGEGGITAGPLVDAPDASKAEYRLQQTGDRLYSVVTEVNGRKRGGVLYQKDDNEFLLWMSGGEKLMLGLKAGGKLPEGEWKAWAAGQQFDCQITKQEMHLIPHQKDLLGPERYRLFPLVAKEGEMRALAVGEDGETSLHSFLKFGDDTYLVQVDGSPEAVFLFKEGKNPDWLLID